MSRLTDTLTDPRKAALIGAATGTLKGLVVGAVAGKLLVFAALGAVGGAAFGACGAYLARRRFGDTPGVARPS